MAPLKSFLIALAVFCSVSVASPAVSAQTGGCVNPALRQEWSNATSAQRTSYLKAVLCLNTKPSRIGLNSSLYNDFPWVHNQLQNIVHGTAMFLPWHRYFVHTYEQALQECGYTGNAMYWDWVRDSAAPSSSLVWSPTEGFGGNGTSDLCVDNGPFVNLTLEYYGNATDPHCLMRDFYPAIPQANLQEMLGFQYTPAILEVVSANTDYSTFHPALECCPHGAVHAGIGSSLGDMAPLTSPNDPIFFMHHGEIDRLWWLWQQEDTATRTYDFAGLEWGGANATLNDVLPMLGLAPDRKVSDVMATNTSLLCYTYQLS